MSRMQAICVVTPNYNMGDYLEETICSVLANLQPGDEYYVIDGGSRDASIDIIERYADRLTGWLSEPDRGYADALAKGFAMSSAPLMCWINCGDLLLEGSLGLRRSAMAAGDVDLLFADDYYIDEQGRVLQHSNGRVADLGGMMLYGGWTPLQDACTWTRSLYDACGGLNAGLDHAADYELFLKMGLMGRSRYLPAVLSAFRRHDSQKSVNGADSYAVERRQVRKHMLATRRPFWPGRLGRGLWYTAAVQGRARLSGFNRRPSRHVGRAVSELRAHYINGGLDE